MASLTSYELTGTKWEILEILSKKTSHPKELAEEIGTTIANISQQLKLLEAYGYIKSERVDKGKGSRKKRSSRIKYSLNKNQLSIISINPFKMERKEITRTHINVYLANILLCDLKKETELLIRLYTDHKELFEHIEALFFLKTDANETHLFVITEKIELFRAENSRLQITKLKENNEIRFWSHTLDEVRKGLDSKEKYFLDQMKLAQLLYEKRPNYSTKLWEEQK